MIPQLELVKIFMWHNIPPTYTSASTVTVSQPPRMVSSAFIYRKVTRLHVTVHFDIVHLYKYP